MPQCKSTTFQLAAIMWQKCPLREPQPPQRPQNPKRDTKPPPKPLLNWRRKKLCEQKLCQTLNTTCACQAIQLKRLFAPKETCKVFANRQNSFLIQLEIAQTHYIELKHSRAGKMDKFHQRLGTELMLSLAKGRCWKKTPERFLSKLAKYLRVSNKVSTNSSQ